MQKITEVSISSLIEVADRLYDEASSAKQKKVPKNIGSLLDTAHNLVNIARDKLNEMDSEILSLKLEAQETPNTFQKGDKVIIDRNDKCVVLREVDGVQKKIELPPNSIDYSLID